MLPKGIGRAGDHGPHRHARVASHRFPERSERPDTRFLWQYLHASHLGNDHLGRSKALQRYFNLIGEQGGRGLIIGIELVKDGKTRG
jgi:hypothetical protein